MGLPTISIGVLPSEPLNGGFFKAVWVEVGRAIAGLCLSAFATDVSVLTVAVCMHLALSVPGKWPALLLPAGLSF